MAHIPLLRMLDSLGAVPDLVVGTSIGSIVGALYASGYSGAEIDSIVTRDVAGDCVRHRRCAAAPSLAAVHSVARLGAGRGAVSHSRARQSARARPTACSRRCCCAGICSRAATSIRCRFRFAPSPPISHNREPVVLATGDLAQAVRASMSIPLAFPPVRIDIAAPGRRRRVDEHSDRRRARARCNPRHRLRRDRSARAASRARPVRSRSPRRWPAFLFYPDTRFARTRGSLRAGRRAGVR